MALADVIKEFINKQTAKMEIYSTVCTVSDVNLTERTCICTPLEGAPMEDVRFQASLSLTSGLVIEPKDGSMVLVSYINTTMAYIALYGEIENIYLDVDTDIVINGGANDGLVKVGDLVTKLNNLESKVNAIIGAYNGHVHPGVTVGPGSTLVTPAVVVGTLTPTVQADLENTKIKH